MQKERLNYLLNLYAKDELSDAEVLELDNWFEEINYNHSNLNLLIKDAGGQKTLTDNLFADFKENYKPKKNQHKLITLFTYASAAIIIMAISFGIYFYQQKNITLVGAKNIVLQKTSLIKPGENKAILTLANGEKINLDDHLNGELLNQKGIKISKTQDGQLLYETIATPNTQISTNTVSTPNGGQYQVILTDGTKVWLNAASTLKYPTKFVGKERTVELNGEAYFEVAHNANAPFKVINKNQTIMVLGTHFNINCYDDENFVKTTLLEGSVKVTNTQTQQTAMLLPGQQTVLAANQFRVKKADTRSTIAWKTGYFRFNDEDLYVIMNQIARWYDVEISYNGDFSNMSFGGYISRNKSINEILSLMEVTKSIKFKIEGRKIIVMK